MRDFTADMAAAKAAAASRRQREGVTGGGRVYRAPAPRRVAADIFDAWVARVVDHVKQTNADFEWKLRELRGEVDDDWYNL